MTNAMHERNSVSVPHLKTQFCRHELSLNALTAREKLPAPCWISPTHTHFPRSDFPRKRAAEPGSTGNSSLEMICSWSRRSARLKAGLTAGKMRLGGEMGASVADVWLSHTPRPGCHASHGHEVFGAVTGAEGAAPRACPLTALNTSGGLPARQARLRREPKALSSTAISRSDGALRAAATALPGALFLAQRRR